MPDFSSLSNDQLCVELNNALDRSDELFTLVILSEMDRRPYVFNVDDLIRNR